MHRVRIHGGCSCERQNQDSGAGWSTTGTNLTEDVFYGWVLEGGLDGRIDYVFFENGVLLVYRSARQLTCNPFQSEAKVNCGCVFHTDSQELQRAVASLQPPVNIDWKGHGEAFEIWKILKLNSGYKCVHVNRCQNDLVHHLARLGRTLRLGPSRIYFSFLCYVTP